MDDKQVAEIVEGARARLEARGQRTTEKRGNGPDWNPDNQSAGTPPPPPPPSDQIVYRPACGLAVPAGVVDTSRACQPLRQRFDSHRQLLEKQAQECAESEAALAAAAAIQEMRGDKKTAIEHLRNHLKAANDELVNYRRRLSVLDVEAIAVWQSSRHLADHAVEFAKLTFCVRILEAAVKEWAEKLPGMEKDLEEFSAANGFPEDEVQ